MSNKLLKPCEFCGTDVSYWPSQEGRKRFCSVRCKNKSANPTKKHHSICVICNKPFTVIGNWQRNNVTCSHECANRARGKATALRDSRVTHTCPICNKTFRAFPSRTARKYCSRKCKASGNTKEQTGKRRRAVEIKCAFCGKRVLKYASRAGRSDNSFCNNECYHKWDSWYKSQPEQIEKLALRALQSLAKNTSKIEDRVAQWLDTYNIEYERQSALGHYSMDFKVGSAYIEVQGCYWHGCPECFTDRNPMQQNRASRDKGKVTYCRNRNIQLYIIWEHDIRLNNFDALTMLHAD